jgi:Xaa-Pro aminopeptidase
MAFSVEPGICLPGRYGARIEDIAVCVASGWTSRPGNWSCRPPETRGPACVWARGRTPRSYFLISSTADAVTTARTSAAMP